MPSVVIVEDHLLLAETLRSALTAQGIETVIAPLAEPPLIVDVVRRMDPRLVLLDLDLGAHGQGIGLIAPLAASGIRTLVVSGTVDRERIALAFEAGAFGYQSKSGGFDSLVAKTSAALSSTEPLDGSLRHELVTELARIRRDRLAAFEPFELLTERERATLVALSAGLSVHGIATEWVISEATVRSHVRGVLAKLQVPSQLGAVAVALRSGWLAAPS